MLMEIFKSFKYAFHSRYEHRGSLLPTSSYDCKVMRTELCDGFHDPPNFECKSLLRGQVSQLLFLDFSLSLSYTWLL